MGVGVRGRESTWQGVVSGVPQGSVLGGLLFVIFIGDLHGEVEHAVVVFFADDNGTCGVVDGEADCTLLQRDLAQMEEWTEKWLLSFHPDGGRCMRLGATRVWPCMGPGLRAGGRGDPRSCEGGGSWSVDGR